MVEVETQLIEAACRGDQTALAQLMTLARPTLKRFARHNCVSSEDAEDAVQVALWKLHQKVGTLRAIPALLSWMFRIIQRECYRFFHLNKKFDALTESREYGAHIPGVPQELHHDLVVAIASLPPLYRQVLVLRDLEELSANEAADQLGISIPAVKSRLHRARLLVRDHLLAGSYLSGEIES